MGGRLQGWVGGRGLVRVGMVQGRAGKEAGRAGKEAGLDGRVQGWVMRRLVGGTQGRLGAGRVVGREEQGRMGSLLLQGSRD